MKFLHIFIMTILLFMSPSTIYGNNHSNFNAIMESIQKGNKYFGNNDNNSIYELAIKFYELALDALKTNKSYGKSEYPIESSDEGYVYGSVSATYQITVVEELAYFLNLNIGKSYVGLCRRFQKDNSHFVHCETARNYLNRAKGLLKDSKYNNKKYTDVTYHLALSYMFLKEYDKVDQIFKQLIGEHLKYPIRHDSKLHATWGVRYGQYVKDKKPAEQLTTKILKKAIEQYEKALHIDPEEHSHINNLGEIYFELGKNNSIMSKKSNNKAKYSDQAVKYYNEAIKYYNEAIFNNPVFFVAYENRGLAYLAWFDETNEEKYTEACRDLKIASHIGRKKTAINSYNQLMLDGKCPKIILDKHDMVNLEQGDTEVLDEVLDKVEPMKLEGFLIN